MGGLKAAFRFPFSFFRHSGRKSACARNDERRETERRGYGPKALELAAIRDAP